MYSREKSQDIWEYNALRKIRQAFYTKEPNGVWERIRRSITKRMLEMSLWAYMDELKKQQMFFEQDYSFMGKEPVFKFVYENTLITMFLPQYKVDFVQSEILQGREFYEMELLRYIKNTYMKKNMVIMDCGANVGNHTVFFKKIMNANKVISFEGNPDTYKTLQRNVQLNDIEESVDLYNCVLGEKTSKASIDNFEEDNIGATSFCENENGNLEMISIDDVEIKEHIDFVKIDVEGFEYYVLKGMKNLLNRDKPLLWLEVFPDKYDKVTSLLTDYGYIVKDEMAKSNYIFECK